MRSALLFILLAAVAAACLGVGELANPPLPQWKFAPGDRVILHTREHRHAATVLACIRTPEQPDPAYRIMPDGALHPMFSWEANLTRLATTSPAGKP